MQQELLRFKNKQIYDVIDTETEHLCTVTAKPWQWTSTILEGNKIQKEVDDFLWWEDLNVSTGAAIVTRFNYYDYKAKAVDPKEVYETHSKYLFDKDVLIIGANIFRFDFYIIGVLQELLGLDKDYSWITRAIDIQCVFKAIQMGYKEVPSDPVERTAWMYRLANYHNRKQKSSVKFMCAQLGVDYDETRAHDAKYDNQLVASCWDKLKWQIDI